MKKSLLSLTAILLATTLPLIAQDGQDPFRDSDFDGHWTGTLRIGGVKTPVAVNLSATGPAVLAAAMLPDGEDRQQSFDPFPTAVEKSNARRIDLVVDTGRLGEKSDEVTLILKYKRATDTLRVKAKGALRGKGDLLRSDTERPLRGIWGGDLLLALEESEEEGSRLAVTEISGFSWSDDPDIQGPIEGTRNGDNVEFTLETRAGDLLFTGQLRGADTELRGQLSLGAGNPGNPGNVSMTRASGGGAMKVQRFAPGSVDAGETNSVTLSGRNLADGLQVDTDVDGVSITGVSVDSATKATISVTVAPGVVAGTRIGLRIRNADGQMAISGSALTVTTTGQAPPPSLISFAAEVEPILANGCQWNNCHTVEKAEQTGGLLLSESTYENIVNVPSTQQPWLMRVQPGDADASYLVRKIRGDEGISGAMMPRDGPGLLPQEIQTIIDWVNQGARRN